MSGHGSVQPIYIPLNIDLTSHSLALLLGLNCIFMSHHLDFSESLLSRLHLPHASILCIASVLSILLVMVY